MGRNKEKVKQDNTMGMMGIMQNDISTPMHIVREETSKTPKDTVNKLFFVVKYHDIRSRSVEVAT